MQQQKENGLVSSPVFSISWWCYRRSCSSEAQKQWHTLWNYDLLMHVKMRIIINYTTGPQHVIWNVNVILHCSQTRGEVLGSEWRWLGCIHADKKSSNALPCNTDFPHFPRRGFCRSCQDSAQWSPKWYAYAAVIQHCPSDAALCRYLWSVHLQLTNRYSSASFQCVNLFSSSLRLNGNNRWRHAWIFWMISNIRQARHWQNF